MNFILESFAMENPQWEFIRASDNETADDRTSLMAEWANRLSGKYKEDLHKKVSFKLPEQYRNPNGSMRRHVPKPKKGNVVR